MEIRQQLKLSQQLVMTPQLQQAIKLLQMSRVELVEMVREELLENPVLEEKNEIGTVSSSHSDSQVPESSSSPIAEQIESDDRAALKESEQNSKQTNEIDWERYLENHAMQAPAPSLGNYTSDSDLPSYEATLSSIEDLESHLIWQMQMGDFLEDELRFATLVIGNLNDNGYLTVEGLEKHQIVPHLAEKAGLDPEDAEEVLFMIQRLDPLGVASRDLKECLLVQAERWGLDELVIKVLEHHLENLEKKNYKAIAKDLQIDMDEVFDVAQAIAELDPRPCRDFTTQSPQYITPDVYVRKVGDEYHVSANDDGMPRLKISNFYRAAMAGDAKAKEYVQNKLRSAQWLIRSIEQRRKTIVRVTECIVEKQRDFFDLGIEHLKPMVLRDIADEIEMHESTISRVTSNKYVHTPRGIFELKYFFNSSIRRDNQEDIASESVKQAIKKIVDGENERKPLSDQKLVEILAQDGINIARRTVAKYREMLGILSSSKRKKYF